MSGRFRGYFEHTVDSKGRVNLPAGFREVIESQELSSDPNFKPAVVLTNFVTDGARCVEGYTLSSWEEFEAKLSEKSRFDPQLRKLENFYLARAVECRLDANGRVNIPATLRAYAGIEKEVVFTSSTHGFRIWNRKVWELIFQEAEQALLEDPSVFVGVDS